LNLCLAIMWTFLEIKMEAGDLIVLN